MLDSIRVLLLTTTGAAAFLTVAPVKEPNLPRGMSLSGLRAESPQPAGQPILLTVVLTVTAPSVGVGPDPYPLLNGTEVRIHDEEGRVRRGVLGNSRNGFRSGGIRKLVRGDREAVPALAPPLPPGNYVVRVADRAEVKITVKQDGRLSQKRSDELLARVRTWDEFAQYVVSRYPQPAVIEGLIKDLLSDDDRRVQMAVHTMLHIRRIPASTEAMITRAMRDELAGYAQGNKRNTGHRVHLGFLAAKCGTDSALACVIELAKSNANTQTRSGAVFWLGQFRQEMVTDVLRGFLTDREESVRFSAAQALADREEPAALPVLLRVARDKNSACRSGAYEALKKYPDDADACAVLKEVGEFVRRGNFGSWFNGLDGATMLLYQPDAQRDLRLTQDQIQAIKKIAAETTRRFDEQRDRITSQGQERMKTLLQLQEHIVDERQKEFGRVLSGAQLNRLRQIHLRIRAPGILLDPEVRREIGLTGDQVQQIKAIFRKERQDQEDLAGGPFQDEWHQTREKYDAIHQRATAEAFGVLSDAQRRAWNTIAGPDFSITKR